MNLSPDINRGTQNSAALPVPDRVALGHSEKLCRRIRDDIRNNGGAISFARYMELTLYEPGLGYYSSGSIKFGGAGDFVTAPVISPLFSECLARQCKEVLSLLPDPVILEIGPGSGAMAGILLAALEQEHCLPRRYYLLEVSADLRERQQQFLQRKIPHLCPRVEWLDRLPSQEFAGIILANEVLDAMPVHRYLCADGKLRELCVGINAERFDWTITPLDSDRLSLLETLLQDLMSAWPDIYLFEVNHRLAPWVAAVAARLRHGLVLLIDYGYPRREFFHPQRNEGTLLCHYRHHVHHDPFLYPGLQDITSSVDFTAVAEAAAGAGLEVKGYTTQAHFLLGCGLAGILEEKKPADTIERVELSRQAQILTQPGEMGERFKVMALTKNMAGPVPGFSLADHRARL